MPGIPYGSQVIDAIAGARILLLVFSGHANRSEHIRRELELASVGEKIIIPFRIENVLPSGSLQYYITGVHWLDAMSPPMDARFNELIALIQKLLDVPVTPPKPTPAPIPGRRKVNAFAIALAAVLLLAVGTSLAFFAHPWRANPKAVVVAKHTPVPKRTHAPAAQPPPVAMNPPVAIATPIVIYVTAKPAVVRKPAAVRTAAPAPSPAARPPAWLTYRVGRAGRQTVFRISRVDATSWRIEPLVARPGYSGRLYTVVRRGAIGRTPGTILLSPNGKEWLFIPDVGAGGSYAGEICFSLAGPGICDAARTIAILNEY